MGGREGGRDVESEGGREEREGGVHTHSFFHQMYPIQLPTSVYILMQS